MLAESAIPSEAPVAPTFEWLVETYHPAVYRFLSRLCLGRRQEAEDLCQEAFLRAFRAFERLPPDAHHRAWIYRIAYNLFLNQRRRAATVELPEELPARDIDHAGYDLARRVAEFVRTLPAKQRAALVLRHVEGRDYAEVAEILGCSEDSARANLFQAVKKIRARFDEEYRES